MSAKDKIHPPVKYSIPSIILVLYISLIPFQKIIWLPVIENKIQITELIFFSLLLFSFPLLNKLKEVPFQITLIDKAIVLWTALLTLNCLLHPNRTTFIELIGQYYLIGVYLLIQIIFIETTRKEILTLFRRALFIQTILILLSIFLGLLAPIIHIDANIFQVFYSYPYFGNIYRLKALTNEPVMLISILSVPLFFTISMEQKSGYKIAIIALLSLLILLTLGKTIPFILAIWVLKKYSPLSPDKLSAYAFKSIAFILILSSIFLTHVIVTKKDHRRNLGYGASLPFYKINDFYLYKSWYFIQKEKALNAFKNQPFTGVGGGNLIHTDVKAHPKTGEKNNTKNAYDPLSTYMGVLAEYGIVGFIGLLFLCGSIFYEWKKTELTQIPGIKWFFFAAFFYFTLEAVSTDILNFRHLWVVISFFSAMVRVGK